jgi:magnesium transporter
MERDLISVPTELDQEEVANIFRRYNVVSLPVVDKARKLVGRITIDDVVDVMQEEASEDIQKMAGIGDEEELKETSVFKISFGRLRWLMVGFTGQLCAAFLMYTFRENIERAAFVAFFVPMMMAMGGNVAIQAATVIVRGIALGEWKHGDLFHRVRSEIRVSLLNGSICSLLLLSIAAVLEGPRFATVLALSLLAVMLNAAVIGTSIPLLARRLGWDPAIAAGPMITTFNDILGIFIYLGVVRVFIIHVT